MIKFHRHIKIASAFILLSVGVPACKKSFLEIEPKGKLIAQKVTDYDQLLSNLSLINIGGNASVAMGDEIAAIEPYFGGSFMKTQRLFQWSDVIYEPNENGDETTGPLQNIYLYNKIINEVPAATDGTDQQKKEIAAEAMAGRAWTYLWLINYFGKPYQNGTAATDPGFPILTTADVNRNKFSRASVKEVYDFVLNDLKTATANLPVQVTHRLRMSKAAAEAILGKTYMLMGQFNEALPHLDAALSGVKDATIPLRLYDYNVTFATGGIFMPVGPYGPKYATIQDNEEILFGKQTYNPWGSGSNELVISPETVSLYTSSDLRLNFYSANAFFGPAYPLGLLRRTGSSSAQFGVVLPDLYLLRAECKARLEDLSGAVTDLETLRKCRMPIAVSGVPTAVSTQKLSLLQFIMQERIREFAAQGHRWFDMRRLSVDPLFSGAVYKHQVYSATGSITNTFTLKPERFVLRIPRKIISQNPGMSNNQ